MQSGYFTKHTPKQTATGVPDVESSGAPLVPEAAPKRNQLLWALVGIALGLGLLYASLRRVDLTALLATLRSVGWGWIAGILGATFGFIAIKAWRWGLLLRFVPGLRFRELHASVYVGLAVNFLVAHVGEFMRAAAIAKQRRVPVSSIFASVLVERSLDFIALLMLLALVLVISPDLPEIVAMAGAVTGVAVAISIAGLYLLLHPPVWLERLVGTLSGPLPGHVRDFCGRQLERSRVGVASIKNFRLMTLAIAASVVQWSLVVVAIWCSGLAVGQTVSLVAAIVTLVLIVIGLALPNSPMQIGTTQLAFVIGLGTGGAQATTAIAASLIYTAFLIIPIMIIGGVLMLQIRPMALLRMR